MSAENEATKPGRARKRMAPRRRRGAPAVPALNLPAPAAKRYPVVLGTALALLVLGLASWWLLARQGNANANVPAQVPVLAPAPAPAPQAKRLIPTATLEQLLAGLGSSGDWQLARLQGNEAVLVIEFPNLLEQGLAFNRAAAYIEKKGSARDRVLNDLELAALVKKSGDSAETFYFGHDYTAEQLRQFFAQSGKQALVLNAQELRLRELLLDAKLLQANSAETAGKARQQVVISFTALQVDDPTTKVDEGVDALRRESTLRHELSHGEFFTRPAYQKQSWDFWQKRLSKAERAMFRRMLAGMDYDTDNEELMANETQAILMHTPDTRAFDAGNLGVTPAQLQELRARFERSR
jgi:hypothetical protein